MSYFIILVSLVVLIPCWARAPVKHTIFADKRDAVPTPVYYGCFAGSRMSFDTSTVTPSNNNAFCQEHCRVSGYMFSSTRKEFCGCTNKHPQEELSGPPHPGATFRAVVTSPGKSSCTLLCSGQQQCEESRCCGGPSSYTVYQVGGVNPKRCKPELMKQLQKSGVDLEMSHLPNCIEDMSKRMDGSKLANTTLDDEECKTDYKTLPRPWACCTPDCDWLLEYLCIDGTVVKCIDK